MSAQQKFRPSTYKPIPNALQRRWMKPARNEGAGNSKWRKFEIGQGPSMTYRENFKMSERRSYGPSNYKAGNACQRSNGGGFIGRKRLIYILLSR